MALKRFRLSARVRSDAPSAVRAPLDLFVVSKVKILPREGGFAVEADREGDTARVLNRLLLSGLRRAEQRTRLRSEWTLSVIAERFFDYVPNGTRTATSPRATGRT